MSCQTKFIYISFKVVESDFFKSIYSLPTVPIVNGNTNHIIPMPLFLPFLSFWNTYLKQGIMKWSFKLMTPIEPSQLYTSENFTSTSSNANIFDGNGNGNPNMNPPLWLFLWFMLPWDLHCEMDLWEGIFNRGHPQNHHNCLTLNSFYVLLQIQIHSL